MTGDLLSPGARADFGQIWEDMVRNWGKDQAARYILAIRNAFQALANGRRQGRPIDDIRPGFRKLADTRVRSSSIISWVAAAAYPSGTASR